MELEISATGPFQALLYMCFKKKISMNFTLWFM